MANFLHYRAGFLICLSVTCSSFWYMSDAGVVNFNFPPETDIQVSADASIYKDVIQLTMCQVNSSLQDNLVWATYAKIIPLWDNSSQALASFSTHFRFTIDRIDGGSGDGIAFFLSPFDFQSSEVESGEWLGLFNSETDGASSNQILAVEFDTFENYFDPDDNHVGINVNSIQSETTFSVSDLYEGAALNNGEKWEAWVDYNGRVAQLQVFLSQTPDYTNSSKPETPVLVYDIDLSQFLPPNVKVGFSASTRVAIETHSLHVWSFSSQ